MRTATVEASVSRSSAVGQPSTVHVGVTPTPAVIRLTTYWDRLRQLEFLPAINHLQPLPPTQRADPLFGVADALSASDASGPILRGMGADVDRLEFRWDQLEPAPNAYDFSALDNTLAMNRQLGFSVLAVVDGTPAWASRDAVSAGNAPPDGLNQPAFLPNGTVNPANPWANFLSVVATRYGSAISGWEIWNEPNTPAFWSGTPVQYARLLNVAQTVLTRTTPSTPLLVGGMVSDDGAFLRTVADTLCPAGPCAGDFPPAVAWHVYDNPADILRLTNLTRNLLLPHDVMPAIWITEANVPVDDPQAPADAVTGPDAVSLSRQAAFVLQAYTLARVAGIQTLMIYRASDVDDRGHYWGLLRGDFSARPALLAYRTAARWLGGTRAAGVSHPAPGVTLASFCGNNNGVQVIWNDGPNATAIPIPATATGATLVDATGSTQPLTPTDGAWRVLLPPAAPPTPFTVPLGLPTLLVTAGACGKG